MANIYGVETRVLKQAVRRNSEKFPVDFMFSLTRDEVLGLTALRSQTVILKRGQHIKHLPFAFTEHGAIMAATVLNSARAAQMSAFVRMRQEMLSRHEMEKRLDPIEKILLVHDDSLKDLYEKIRPLLLPPPEPPRPRSCFSSLLCGNCVGLVARALRARALLRGSAAAAAWSCRTGRCSAMASARGSTRSYSRSSTFTPSCAFRRDETDR